MRPPKIRRRSRDLRVPDYGSGLVRRRSFGDLFVGLVTAIMGFGAIALGVFLFRDAIDFAARAETAVGEVVSVRASSSRATPGQSPGRTSFYVTVRFEDADGVSWEAESENGSGTNDWRLGQQVTLRYIAGDPPRARVDAKTPEMPVIALGFFLLVGAPFAMIGVVLTWKALRRW